MAAGRELPHLEPSQHARFAPAVPHENVARVERTAEDLGPHRPAKVRREIKLRHHVIPHPLRPTRLGDFESGQRESVRLHKVHWRVNVVYPCTEWDVRVRVGVQDVGVDGW